MNWLNQLLGVQAAAPIEERGTPAWNTATAARKRQQLVIDALRQQASQQTPEGTVKGGGGGGDIFGARPGIYSGGANAGTALAQGLAGLGAGYAQRNMDMGEAGQEQAMKADRQRWLESFYGDKPPQATAQAAPPPNMPPPMPGFDQAFKGVPAETAPAPNPVAPGGRPLDPTLGGQGQVPLVPSVETEHLLGVLDAESPPPLAASGSDQLIPSNVPGGGYTTPTLTATAAKLPPEELAKLLAEADVQIGRNQVLLEKTLGQKAQPQQSPQGEEAGAPEYDPMAEHRKMMLWAGRGMDNPLSQTMAQKIWDTGADFPEKRTLAQERQSATSADKLRSLEAMAARLDIQLADRALDRKQRAVLQEQRLSLQAAIANEANRTRRMGYELQASLLPYTMSLKQSQIDEKARGKPMGDKDKEIIAAAASTANGLSNLLSTFDDKYAGWGAAGPAVRTLGNLAGSWAPEDIQKMDNWWAEFEMLAELPMRHEMFGAALTATEKQAWNNAQRVRANKDPQKVREALQHMIGIAQRKGAKFREALVAEGKNPDAIDALLGGPDLDSDTDRIEVRRGKRKSDGATVIEYSDGTREVIQ